MYQRASELCLGTQCLIVAHIEWTKIEVGEGVVAEDHCQRMSK